MVRKDDWNDFNFFEFTKAFSFQCMTKFTTKKKKKSNNNNHNNSKKKKKEIPLWQKMCWTESWKISEQNPPS